MPSQPVADLIKPVRILSETPAPPMTPVAVQLHYREAGEYKLDVVPMMRPIYYDKVVVSALRETLQAIHFDLPKLNSPKEIARAGYYTARRLRNVLSGPVKVDEPVIDLRAVETNNIAHLLTDLIPRYLMAKALVGPGLMMLLRRQPVGTFAELLAYLKIEPTVELRAVEAEVIRIRGMRALQLYELFEGYDCFGLHFNPEAYTSMSFPAPAAGFERLFLARRKSPRMLTNMAAVEAVTTRFGYKTVYLEDFPVSEQLGIGANVKHIVAPHGAALALTVGNRAIGSVVELFPPNAQQEFYPGLLGPHIGAYHQIVPEYDPRVAQSGWDAISSFKFSNFAVDPTLLERILSEIHA
jgi:hypothetical protein